MRYFRLLLLALCVAGLGGCDCDAVVGADSGVESDASRDAASSSDSGRDSGSDADSDTDSDEDCIVSPVPEAFANPARELHWGDLPPELFPDYVQVIHTPLVVDLIDDGPDDYVPEIVLVTYRRFEEPGVLRVFSGRAPHTMIFTVAGRGEPNDPTDVPLLHFDGHPAAGDINGDQRIEIVVGKTHGGLIAYRDDGSVLWETDEPPFSELAPNASIALADLDGNGSVEIVVGRVVLDSDGNVLWTGDGTAGRNRQGPLSCVADLDQDGTQEVIAGRTVYTWDGRHFWQASDRDGFCAVADVFAGSEPGQDLIPEVIRVTQGSLIIHAGVTGEELLEWPIPSSGDLGGAPTVADFDGDGHPEIGIAGSTKYVVYDPDIGAALWQVTTEDDSSRVTAATVFDFNGDGSAEVVYNDEQYFRVLSGVDGSTLFEEPNPSRTRTEEPVVADVDGDGNAEIVFVANTEADFAGDRLDASERVPGFEIWGSADDSWVPARSIWNQHTYHITNVGTGGAIPAGELPSWVEHNTYRLNSQGERVIRAPDLVPVAAPFDTSRCNEGVISVCAEVENRGDVVVGPGIQVSFRAGAPGDGGSLIGTAETTRRLGPGDSEVVCASWQNAPAEQTQVFAIVDSAGQERECREDNNAALLGEARCDVPQ